MKFCGICGHIVAPDTEEMNGMSLCKEHRSQQALEGKAMTAELTDAAGNPVEVNNHPVREKRTDYHPGARPTRYAGYIPAPQVYSTLAGDMVSTGVDLYQCGQCGYWMSSKMSPSDEMEHDRQHTR